MIAWEKQSHRKERKGGQRKNLAHSSVGGGGSLTRANFKKPEEKRGGRGDNAHFYSWKGEKKNINATEKNEQTLLSFGRGEKKTSSIFLPTSAIKKKRGGRSKS